MDLSTEDAKLVTLARATRARVGAAQGAAVRDADGRTYAAATVDLPSLKISALQVCVAMAVASGSSGLGAAVLLGEDAELVDSDQAALSDFGGAGVTVHLGDPRGTISNSTQT
ncbi:cytidine deaminase [Nocardioides sp.]|uniref:cytidine deaminase n=1 Tax=Nocardioides sp. TaxID=35761 RepID=UPI002B27A192|nr:cytidine deaminase [Nocardioides sp.]